MAEVVDEQGRCDIWSIPLGVSATYGGVFFFILTDSKAEEKDKGYWMLA